MKHMIEDFLINWGKTGKPEIYNEDSLKFELGLYLKNELQKKDPNYKVQFERNIVNLFMDLAAEERNVAKSKPKKKAKAALDKIKKTIKNRFAKTEIDILMFKGDNPWDAKERYAIELKYSTREDGATEQREGMKKDIKFVQQLVKQKACDNAYAVTLANDIFRAAGLKSSTNCFKNNPITTNGKTFNWGGLVNSFSYYIVEAK